MTIDEYISQHTSPQGPLLESLERRAHVELMRPRMLSGHIQGRLLKLLALISKPRYILELGTYTGYAAICLAEALSEDGELHTIESDDEMLDFIHRFVSQSPQADRIHLHHGNALDLIPQLVAQYPFDLVYIDANKREYVRYYDLLIDSLPQGALILADNTLWDEKVALDPIPQDAQTQGIDHFNKLIAADPRVEQVILPLRDGLSLIYKL
ncbi:MAG: class I SAM-dependent methyltransferase [Porphyromonas sp.]|nr:class I SAM-dependent methyltransferase [Porphyromonas sp.]